MTIQQYDERNFSLDELYEFCNEINDWSPFDEILIQDSVEEEINECLCEYVRDHDWREVRDMLDEINISDGSWFIRDDYSYLGYICVDDDEYFADEMKGRVKELLTDADYFDEEDDEENESDDQIELDFDLLWA